MDEQRQWHRLFGMSWMDYLHGQPFKVEMEMDLSMKLQLLDVVVIRKGPGALSVPLPDGFDELADHNLISFKSYQEAFDGWALNEFVGHYVNYRKQAGPTVGAMPPETAFRLYAVSVRFPRGLNSEFPLQPIREGVYEVRHFTGTIRLVVVNQLPQAAQNAMLHLFSANEAQVRFVMGNYQPRSQETSTFLHQLYERYQQEGLSMAFSKEEFVREAMERMCRDPVVIKIVLENVSDEQRLQGVPVEQRLQGVPVEQRLQGVPMEELLQSLTAEQRAALLARLQAEQGGKGSAG